MSLVFELFGLLLVVSGAVAVQQECGISSRRLPEQVQAKHYELHMEPSLKELSFKGRVRIDLAIDSLQGNQIMFHADEGISLDESNIKFVMDGNEVPVINVCRNNDYQLVVLTLKDELPPHKLDAQLFVSFFGPLRDDMFGFYKSNYYDSQKHEHFLATTQFAATEARKAFPCLDEPLFKSTYQMTIVHEPEFVALSNTEAIEEKTLDDGRKLVKFATTPPMSTYLLAFVVGQFDYIEKAALGGRLRLRVYATAGESHKGQFVLDTACRAIQLMEEYFGIEFPLNKIDLIGIPDFYNQAMENWGLITIKEISLLVDERETTPVELEKAALLMIHELAHQWFGNLVTMRWWNDLWLNEGFATWMAYHILEQVHPQFDTKHRFLVEVLARSMDTDSKEETHAIRSQAPIESTVQIASLFDLITYEKAAAVLNFIHNDYLGPELFKKSLRHYMAKHKYGNTVTDDLTASMEEVSKMPVKPILNSWILQEGHPLLNIDYDPDQNMVMMVQERFHASSTEQWIIPLTMIVVAPGKEEIIKTVIKDDGEVAAVQLPSWFKLGEKGHWFKLNHEFSGFYRVWYPTELLVMLEEPIREKKMSSADRLNIVNDAHALWKTDFMQSDEYINLLTWFENEDKGDVLTELVYHFYDLLGMATNRETDQTFLVKIQMFMGRLLRNNLRSPVLSDSTVAVEPLDEAGLAEVLYMLATVDNDDAISASLQLFEMAGRDINKVRVALRPPVYMAISRGHNTDQLYDQMLEFAENTRSRPERNRLIPALAKTNSEDRRAKLDRKLDVFKKTMKVDFTWSSITSSMRAQATKADIRRNYRMWLIEREKERKHPTNSHLSSKEKLLAKTIDEYLEKTGGGFKPW